MDVLTPSRLNISAVESDVNLEKLVVTIDVVKHILSAVEHQLSNALLRDLRLGDDLSVLGADRVLLGAVHLSLV